MSQMSMGSSFSICCMAFYGGIIYYVYTTYKHLFDFLGNAGGGALGLLGKTGKTVTNAGNLLKTGANNAGNLLKTGANKTGNLLKSGANKIEDKANDFAKKLKFW